MNMPIGGSGNSGTFIGRCYSPISSMIQDHIYNFVKTTWLLSNVIDADHQNSCFFTNKGHFSSPLCVLIGVLAKFDG